MASHSMEIAERLLTLARAAGADAADVLVVHDTTLTVGVAGGTLEEAERSEQAEAGLRVLIGARQASVASSDTTPEALAVMAERAVAMAREAPEDSTAGLPDPEQVGGHGDPAALDLVDRAEALGLDDLERLAIATEAAALGVAGVSQVEQASASRYESAITLAASNGFRGAYARTASTLGVSAIAGEGMARETDYSYETRRHRADLPTPDAVGQKAGQRAAAAVGPRKPPGGVVPVLYDERIAGGLIRHVLSAINGASVARGSSWLREAMGTAILPDGLSLHEDPLIVRGLASRPFDAEGIAARAQPLVEDGRLTRWVLDCAAARRLGLTTTGNARRGTSGPPSPGVTNVRLTGGQDQSRDDLIRAMGTGLLVTSLIGSSINPTTGAYSRGASGFWVERGEIAYPVNEITVAGSLPLMMRTIVPANDADPWSSVQVPSLLVEGLTVGV